MKNTKFSWNRALLILCKINMLYTSPNCACALFYLCTARRSRWCGLLNDIRSTAVRLLQNKA